MTKFASRRAVPRDQVLLHELNHRVNNEFAAAISVVSLAAARSRNDEVKAALSEVTELLHQCADVHRALQVPEYDILLEAERYVRQLCLSITRSYLDHRKIKLVLATQPLRLEADRCWRLGMIVYELIINSVRHAFLGGAGEIRVELSRAGVSVRCSVTDNGSAAVMSARGRGCQIINELSRSLGGRLEQTFGPRGSRSILVFPYKSEPDETAKRAQREVEIPEHGARAPEDGPSTAPC